MDYCLLILQASTEKRHPWHDFGENIAFTGSAIIFIMILIAFIVIKIKFRRYVAPLFKENKIFAT